MHNQIQQRKEPITTIGILTGFTFADRIIEFGYKAEEKGLFIQNDQYDWGHVFRALDRYIITCAFSKNLKEHNLTNEDTFKENNPTAMINSTEDKCHNIAYQDAGLEQFLNNIAFKTNHEPHNQTYDHKVNKLQILLTIYLEIINNNLSLSSETKLIQEKLNSKTPIPGAPRGWCDICCIIIMIILAFIITIIESSDQ